MWSAYYHNTGDGEDSDLKSTIAKGWGGNSSIHTQVYSIEEAAIVKSSCLAFGSRQSYGDSSLAEIGIDTKSLLTIHSFDTVTGIISLDAGLTLHHLLTVSHPHHWTLNCVPGTPVATIGGAIASDVHGKDSMYAGTFTSHVRELSIQLHDNKIVTISPQSDPDLFFATCGGMGLTGIILRAKIQLRKIDSICLTNSLEIHYGLEELITYLEQDKADYKNTWLPPGGLSQFPYSSLTFSQNFTQLSKTGKTKKLRQGFSINFNFNFWTTKTIKIMNFLYYLKKRFLSEKKVTLLDAFFPMDSLVAFNTTFGQGGLIQVHFILPRHNYRQPIEKIFDFIKTKKCYPVLTSLKLFKRNSEAMLGFAIPGISFAMDFTASTEARELVQMINELVSQAGGRSYLTKDSELTQRQFETMYPRSRQFNEVRKKFNADKSFASIQSKRVGLD